MKRLRFIMMSKLFEIVTLLTENSESRFGLLGNSRPSSVSMTTASVNTTRWMVQVVSHSYKKFWKILVQHRIH